MCAVKVVRKAVPAKSNPAPDTEDAVHAAGMGNTAAVDPEHAGPEPDGDQVLDGAADGWPNPLGPIAFHGLAGKIVRTILPHTEADEAALLLQLLAVFGNAIGRGPHHRVEGNRHGCNLFVAIVGESGKARKGTSWAHNEAIARIADPTWTLNCISNGLRSGPGLINQVRDPVEKLERVRADDEGKPGSRKVIVDPGVEDKRLLVMEPELASVFQIIGTNGNDLSRLLRQAWDGVTLNAMIKTNPIRATDPHISIIGHVTDDELRRTLRPSQLTNGFANRFLFVCARRSKFLAEGGSLADDEVEELGLRLGKAIEVAREIGRVERDDEARALWAEMYRDLSDARPGLLGAATSRAESQVLRVSMIYALLDGSSKVRSEHLQAAREVWRYCEDSARYALGGTDRDLTIEKLLIALRAAGPKGLTQTEIRDLFNRHLSAAEIRRALDHLVAIDAAEGLQEKTGGRPAIRWRALE